MDRKTELECKKLELECELLECKIKEYKSPRNLFRR